MVYVMWGQCRIDIFLLDWEKPAKGQPTNQIAELPPAGGVVSIWRTYFVANEWNELQTIRRGLHPLSTLLTALLFLQVSLPPSLPPSLPSSPSLSVSVCR